MRIRSVSRPERFNICRCGSSIWEFELVDNLCVLCLARGQRASIRSTALSLISAASPTSVRSTSRGFSYSSIPVSVRSNKAHAAASKLPSPHFHVTSSSVATQASSCFAAPCFPHRRSSPHFPALVAPRAFSALLSALPGDQTTSEVPRKNGSHAHHLDASTGYRNRLYFAQDEGKAVSPDDFVYPECVSSFISRTVQVYICLPMFP